jgi:hypothetical protein
MPSVCLRVQLMCRLDVSLRSALPLPHTGSTLVAIAMGILLVQLVRPGRNAPFDSLGSPSATCGDHYTEHAKTAAKGAACGWLAGCWLACKPN